MHDVEVVNWDGKPSLKVAPILNFKSRTAYENYDWFIIYTVAVTDFLTEKL